MSMKNMLNVTNLDLINCNEQAIQKKTIKMYSTIQLCCKIAILYPTLHVVLISVDEYEYHCVSPWKKWLNLQIMFKYEHNIQGHS